MSASKYLTQDIPGIGGKIKQSPEDFIVEEIPLTNFTGAGEHTIILIEKRNLTTMNAIKRICKELNYPARDVGFAGQKDAVAVAKQYLSFQLLEPAKFQKLDFD